MGGGPNTSGLNFGVTYVLSAASACVAETATFPFDIVKTRLMLQGEAAVEQGVSRVGLVGMAQGIVREEGARGLYRGLSPACLRHIIYSGTRVMAYEFLRERVLKKDENGAARSRPAVARLVRARPPANLRVATGWTARTARVSPTGGLDRGRGLCWAQVTSPFGRVCWQAAALGSLGRLSPAPPTW